ncbi:zinc-binding dehydrogenase [Phenylobacterium sp.]|uniref:zinc-binding dehydrogenase n=1 Tax=Phenylobacterium sp. TaxID=1871053 RepID=UPI00272FA4AD|nr:zinc-binding dehydrogenase [Phenylobacterium sp.]MDP2212453.1 zinc-binding dehydrogenase [Phenylobacterium sp.]
MTFDMQTTGLQLRSLVKASGELELSLVSVPVQPPGPGEVLVRVEASPINPSDLGLLVSAADMSQAKASGTAASPVITAPIPPAYMKAITARVDESMPVGNEGAGVVVAAGEGAEGLIGKTVALLGGAMYAQYRTVRAADVLLLPDDVTPAEGASCFVNPLTALGMVETMRREGHTALVHTAAASNLGQMLNRLCLKDGVPLVNIVRSAEQAALLKGQGAVHVLDSTSPNFTEELTEALVTTGATLAFDAIGGGRLVGQILTAMEVAANRKATEYSRYGSTTYKQAYIYGGLDTRPTELNRGFGMSWGVGGWLLTPFLMKIGAEAAQALRQRVASELKTTFASHYTAEISLAEALQPDILAAYNRRATGEKYLITPNKGV